MTTLLTGTLERTVGWFHPGAQQQLARDENVSTGTHAPERHAIALELRVRQWLCAATRGHEFLRGVDGPRMYLICQHCFHETAGWKVDARPPRSMD